MSNASEQAPENQRESLQAELRVYYGPSRETVLYGFSVDMSTGGLFLKTDVPLSIHEEVLLSFTLPDVNKVVNCRAKVAWVNREENPNKPSLPTGVGLQFLEPSGEYLASIQSLLRHDGVLSVSEPEG